MDFGLPPVAAAIVGLALGLAALTLVAYLRLVWELDLPVPDVDVSDAEWRAWIDELEARHQAVQVVLLGTVPLVSAVTAVASRSPRTIAAASVVILMTAPLLVAFAFVPEFVLRGTTPSPSAALPLAGWLLLGGAVGGLAGAALRWMVRRLTSRCS